MKYTSVKYNVIMALCRFCGLLRSSVQFGLNVTYSAVQRTATVGYKSRYSLDKIYPDSDQNFLREFKSTSMTDSSLQDEPFSGEIPIDQLEITTVRSSGPGGQHVNTTNSKVEIRFHVESASWIPLWIRERLLEKQKHRITKAGYMIIRSEKSRKQLLNQADCFERLRKVIFDASIKEHEPTTEELEEKENRIMKAKERNVKNKRFISLKKSTRGSSSI